MSSKHSNSRALAQVKERIENVDVTDEMQDSFLEYAYSVIYSRALPDARDGLKPVQRRILYTMDAMGLTPDKGYVKSSRVIGEVMGKYHPHGDSAIYDALVRQAQNFSLRLPLVDGHGNFGSLDDGPAASRYTEARLAAAALAMTGNLEEDTVPFVPNYDNQLQQPEVLPSALPNLLVNGATGIAVGMATNMPPHNLCEAVAAIQHLIIHPDATLEELMEHIPGPDFPTGGSIAQMSGIKDAYRTGRGSFKIRATAVIEPITARKQGIIVTELPYMVGPEKVIDRIKDAVNSKKLQGISDVVDLTDRVNGLRLQVEVKTGFNPEAVLEQLYRYTPMEDSFGVNNVALVDGQPRVLALKEMLQVYVGHRLDVVTRRTKFRLRKRQARLHLVQGLLIAIADIDGVIAIIRTSEETAQARDRLMSTYSLTHTQADHILELRLRQLTKYSLLELEQERERLMKDIAELENILASDANLRTLVSTELSEVAAKHGTERRTILGNLPPASIASATAVMKDDIRTNISSAPRTSAMSLEIKDDPCWIVLNAHGQIGRTSSQEPLSDAAEPQEYDVLRAVIPATARTEIGVVTSHGRMIRIPVVNLPIVQLANGTLSYDGCQPIAGFVTFRKEEKAVSIVPLSESFALGTLRGIVKRVVPDYPQTYDEWEIISLKEGDHVIGAAPAHEDDALVFITKNTQLLHYKASLVRPQGRQAAGMVGIKLAPDDLVVFFGVVTNGDSEAVVVTVADSTGFTKVSSFSDFPAKGRATSGVRAQRLLKDERELRLAWAGHGPAHAATQNGQPRKLPRELAKRDASGTAVLRRFDVIGPSLS